MLEVSYSQNYHLLILERLSMHIKVRSSFGSSQYTFGKLCNFLILISVKSIMSKNYIFIAHLKCIYKYYENYIILKVIWNKFAAIIKMGL